MIMSMFQNFRFQCPLSQASIIALSGHSYKWMKPLSLPAVTKYFNIYVRKQTEKRCQAVVSEADVALSSLYRHQSQSGKCRIILQYYFTDPDTLLSGHDWSRPPSGVFGHNVGKKERAVSLCMAKQYVCRYKSSLKALVY